MAETAMSQYVVLRQVATPDEKYPTAWVVLGTVSGRSQAEAVKALADKNAVAVYSAVPARSWSAVKITPSTVTTLALEEVPAEAPTRPPAVEEVQP